MKNPFFGLPLFLEQGNPATKAENEILTFIAPAKKNLHIAIYDFQLTDALKTKDPAPRGTQLFVQSNFPVGGKVLSKPIAGSHLMHNKW